MTHLAVVINYFHLKIEILNKTSSYKLTNINLKLAFKDKSNQEITKLSEESFIESVVSLFETFHTWGSNSKKSNKFKIFQKFQKFSKKSKNFVKLFRPLKIQETVYTLLFVFWAVPSLRPT